MRELFRMGQQVIDVDRIVEAHWEGGRLFARFSGGTFVAVTGEKADTLWRRLLLRSGSEIRQEIPRGLDADAGDGGARGGASRGIPTPAAADGEPAIAKGIELA